MGIAGSHVRGVNSRGGIRSAPARATSNARTCAAPWTPRAPSACRKIAKCCTCCRRNFWVDQQDSIRDPIGMVGQKLEVNVHIVTASAAATQNVVTAVNRAGVVVTDTALEPLASAEAVLTQDERELGCCLLDIGGGTTELVVFAGGVVRHAAALPVGGDHFTNDLAVGLRTPIPEAEKIKREHGCAWHELLGEDTPIEIASVGDRPPRTVFARMLNEIIEPRAQELLALVRDELKRAGLDTQIPAGLVLAGGGAKLSRLGRTGRAHVFAARAIGRAARPRGHAGSAFPARIRNRSRAAAVWGARPPRGGAASHYVCSQIEKHVRWSVTIERRADRRYFGGAR